jgi:signal transduction histidine kinase
MKISTKLLLSMFVPALLALLVIVALAFSYQDMRRTQANGDTVREIRTSITELNHIVFSYILYHEERPKQQFLEEHDQLTKLIMGTQLQNPDQQRLLDSIRENSVSMKDNFSQLVSNYERSTGSSGLTETNDRLVSLLLQKSYEADTNAALLRSQVDAGINDTETRTIGLILLVLVLATIPLTILLFQTRRSITTSLSTLNKGTAIIGSGNLNYRIETKARDELGDLARSFNQMTSNLNNVTASKTELEAANKELEAFSYSVSHDLRTPLRSLEGFSSALLEGYNDKLDEKGQHYLERLRAASVLMGQLIDDILKLSRITRAEFRKETVDISQLAETVVTELRSVDPERQVEVMIKPNLVTRGDPRLLLIALQNLIGNAWKFTSKVPSAKIEIGDTNHEGTPAYFIRDNGAGFDMTYADKLFQPFQRLHKATDYPGTGIGLATVQRIIRRHGGKIWAESTEGRGTTFYFTLS